jgi:choline kinase
MVRGIILAAGSGSRLNGAGDEEPKCLMRLGGRFMLERQIGALREAGIDDIGIVVGHGAERVRRMAGGAVHYVENMRFAQTNSLYSLWLARPLLLDGFVVLNCDVLFHPQMLVDLLTTRCDAAALVAYRTDGEPLGEEEMKVRVRRGRVVEFSKQMPPDEADGENVGMLKFHAPAARALVAELDRLVAAGHARDFAPRGFGEFARRHPLYAIATRGYPWIEIDFPEDYERACTDVLPAIERIRAGAKGTLLFDPPDGVAGAGPAWPVLTPAPETLDVPVAK